MSFVKKEIAIDAPRQIVWRYLQEPDLLAAWLMRNDFRAEEGREFRFFAKPAGEWDGIVHCRVTELDPPNRLSFTWSANDIGAETLVTIELTEEDRRTRLRLIHTNFEDAPGDVEEIVRRHDGGWADHLAVLALQVSEDAAGERVAPPVDWTGFSLHVAIDATPDQVLDAWRTVSGMESFFVEMMRIADPDGRERSPDERAEPGDRFIWRWHNGRRLEGEYLDPGGPDEVRFTFGASKISVRSVPYRGGTLLVLRQYEIPDDEPSRMHVHANCRGGWVYFMTILKILQETGVDGRDKTRETGASFSTYFDPGAVAREAQAVRV